MLHFVYAHAENKHFVDPRFSMYYLASSIIFIVVLLLFLKHELKP